MRQLGSSTLLFSRLALKILVILLLCGVLPTSVVELQLIRQNNENLRARAAEAIGTQLARRKAAIEVWVAERQHEATRWASSFYVLDAVETMLASPADARRTNYTLNDHLQMRLGTNRVYESLFVVDARGKVLAMTRAERLEQAVRQRIAESGDPEGAFVSLLPHSEVLDRPTLLIVHPIRGRLGTTLAFLVQRGDVRELEALLGDAGASPPLSFWLLARGGGIVARRGPHASEPDPSRLLEQDKGDEVRDGSLSDGTLVLHDDAQLAEPLAGRLIAAIAKADAERPQRRSDGQVLIVVFVVIAAMVTALLWATRGVLRPILFLSEGARRLSAGDLNVYLPVWGRDEVGALTAIFNEMIRRLREGRETIEDARDELARANEDLRAANQTLEALAITDGLTGLYNHRHFQDTLEREIRRCDREGRPLSLLMLDIDHFKQFNDRWGHTEGDAALRRVAGAIMRTIRASDSAFRYGGEELAVLLPGCMKEQARDVAEKMRLAVEDSWSRRGAAPAPRLSISAGVATSPEDARAARSLVDAADAALYAAKARGRNCVVMAGADNGGSLVEA